MIITITAMQNNEEITTWGEKNQDFFFFSRKKLLILPLLLPLLISVMKLSEGEKPRHKHNRTSNKQRKTLLQN